MNRWAWLTICSVVATALLVCGLLVPSHLRAVDARVLSRAGQGTPALVQTGLDLTRQQQLGVAAFLSSVANRYKFPGYEQLAAAVANLAKENPALLAWGTPATEFASLTSAPGTDWSVSRKVTNLTQSLPQASLVELVVRQANQDEVFRFLERSPNVWAKDLTRTRALTNTVLLPASASSAGRVFDAAVLVCGLLVGGGHFTPEFKRELSMYTSEALRGGGSQQLEQVLMDLLSLGQRCSWGQLTALVSKIETPDTLHRLAAMARKSERQMPIWCAAIQLTGKPQAVADYLTRYGDTGASDLGTSLRFGAGGVNELLARGQRLCPPLRGPVSLVDSVADAFAFLAWRFPGLSLTFKWGCFLLSGFLFALAMHFGRRPAAGLERPLVVRGIHVAREGLFALGFLLVVLLLCEPFLAQENQKVEFPLKLRLPMAAAAAGPGINIAKSSIMNQLSLLTLLLFFVLQGLLYVACLVKLAEIRRQKVPARIRLRLLENEDHLFDAGLYLGFVGTIISLILVSLGVIKPSLMAAYSSTSFGIIFVSIFKIFHLRPARRRLLLEAENQAEGSYAGLGTQSVSAAS